MTPRMRKLALTAHVTSSVGWLGAVASFFALAIAGFLNQSTQTACAAYIAMKEITWAVIVPFCCASFLTGIVGSLGTPWGLFRHYWVVAKLVLTALATVVLMAHTRPVGALAYAAAHGGLEAVGSIRTQLLLDSAGALLVLLMATILAIYKPRGLTRYGWSKQRTLRAPRG